MARFLSRADTGADALLRWTGVFTLVVGGYTWLASNVTWFGQLNLAEQVAVAIPAALVTVLSVTSSLALYRYFRPLSSTAGGTPQGAEGSIRAVDILNQVETQLVQRDERFIDRFASLEASHKAVIDDYQRMCGLEAKLEDWRQERLNIGTAMEELEQRLMASMSLSADTTRQQIASLYNALSAVYHRERLRELAGYIEQGAVELGGPTVDGVQYDAEQWEEWEIKERGWRSILQVWCELAACYVEGADLKIMTVSEDQYRQGGVAQPHQFPGEGLITYKAFWARLKNWRNWKGEVERAVHQVAFNGASAPQRTNLFNHFPERPDEERN